MEEFGLGIGQRAIPTSTIAKEFGYRFVLSGSVRNGFIFSQHISTFLYSYIPILELFIFVLYWRRSERKKQFVSLLDYRNTFSHGLNVNFLNVYDFTNMTSVF